MSLKDNFTAICDSYHLNGKYDTLAKFHLDSFNKFTTEDITKILLNYNPIIIEDTKGDRKVIGILRFTNIYCTAPSCVGKDQKKKPVYPNECRLLGKTYSFIITAHYTFEIREKRGNEPEKTKFQIDSLSKGEPFILGKVPLMVKSKLCSLAHMTPEQLQIIHEDSDERGCYFIVSGNEYAIIAQENKAENFIFKNIDLKDKKIAYSVWIQSKCGNRYVYPYYTIVQLTTPLEIPTIQIAVTISKSKGTYIPMKILFMALGVIVDKEIFSYICENEDEHVKNIILESLRSTPQEIKTKNDAILHIVKLYKKNPYYMYQSNNEDDIISNMVFELNERQLLPHIGGASELKKKVLFLGQMVKSVVRLYLGYDKPVDRDNYGNKRILSPGLLMGQLFKYSTDILIKDAKKSIQQELASFDISKDYTMIIVNNFREKKINMAKNISQGKWPAGFTKKEKDGVSQLREIKSSMDILSYLVKVVTPVMDTGTAGIGMREIPSSTYGYLCPADTPDGANVGLIKHLTHMAIISEYIPSTHILSVFKQMSVKILEVENIHYSEIGKFAKIYLNGVWSHCVALDDLSKFVTEVIDKRRKGIIYRHTSIVRNYEERLIRILTDGGRLLRPVLIVDKGNKLRIQPEHYEKLRSGEMSFDDLQTAELLEYIDIHESEYNCLIAQTEDHLISEKNYAEYTHCEIDECCILSINSLMTPWANYNQGPRVSFENTMRKQTIGINLTNYQYRMDNSIMIMPYAQLPLVCTIGEKYTGLDRHPYGTNLLMAIAPGDGYNLDDATKVNRDTVISNDLMTIYNYKTYVDSLDGNDEAFLKPVMSKCVEYKYLHKYDAVGNDGMPIIGAVVNKGDILTGHIQYLTKTEKEHKKGKFEYLDRTLQYEESVPGVIENWALSEDENGVQTLKIKIRLYRPLKIGDKLASTASQKGIVSSHDPDEEMIYDEDGYTPDILFNPHGIITRMTMSHLFEPLAGTIALLSGKRVDATPFCRMTKDDLISSLEKLGLKDFGEKYFYDGRTGKRIKHRIYSGFIYYQRLKHMVDDKIFARGTGQIVPKSKQAIHGRKKGGGIRVGNMERDTLISHGASMTMKEFFFDKADKFEEFVSGKSGMFCTGNSSSGIYEDKANLDSLDINRVHIPWTTKMLQEYIGTLGIGMSMMVESDKL